MRFSHAPVRAACLVAGLALAAAGCGPSSGQLTGKVTYQGNALKGGTVTLIPADSGPTFSTKIEEDGTYKFEQRVPTGKYKVCVETESLRPARTSQGPSYAGRPGGGADRSKIKNQPPKGAELPEGYRPADPFGGGAAEAAKRYVPIPDKYANPGETPLTVDVKGGAQAHDIPLS